MWFCQSQNPVRLFGQDVMIGELWSSWTYLENATRQMITTVPSLNSCQAVAVGNEFMGADLPSLECVFNS